MPTKIINTLSFFSGGGGLDLGFSAAGYNILFSTDIDPYSCSTLQINQNRKNFYGKHVVTSEDINNLMSQDILDRINKKKGEIDFIIGGPPCQAFSIFGRRKGLDDPRGNLVFEYARLIDEIEPTGFLFENVSGLKTIHNGDLFNNLLDVFSFNGKYSISVHEYQLADYGIPQFRNRVFLIGFKNGNKISPMKNTHSAASHLFDNIQPFKTVGNALANMPEPSTQSALFNHIGRVHSERIV
ncbi:MAG: DNA cytosine methyltransferase, partial [Bacteroidota bacterium]